MARGNGKLKKLLVISAAGVLLLLVAGGGALYFARPANKFANLPAFPVDAYLAGGTLWSDEDYLVEGRVDNLLMRSKDDLRLLVSIEPKTSDTRLPVVLDRAGGKLPLQREQKLQMKVHLGSSGEIVCTDYSLD